MRTLVISDLHLGSRDARDVLRQPAPLEALKANLADIDRLVLLGDIVELLDGRATGALEDALPVLREIGTAMAKKEILLAAGNHDHALVRAWLRRRREQDQPLGAATRVPADATEYLEEVTSALRIADAHVRVHYPGIWLRHDVFAHHGHYVERHLASATVSRITAAAGEDALSPAEQYEISRSPSFAAASLLIRGLTGEFEESIDRVGGFARAFVRNLISSGEGTPLAPRAIQITNDIVERRVQKGGLPAIVQVAEDLGALPRAEHVLFGHVHRLGPVDGDYGWRPDPKGPKVWNSGCWVLDPMLCGDGNQDSPFWPGGALLIEDEKAPKVIRLLQGLQPDDLRMPALPTNEDIAAQEQAVDDEFGPDPGR